MNDLKRVRIGNTELVADGNKYYRVRYGTPDGDHNCDEMGCNSIEHVVSVEEIPVTDFNGEG